MAWMFSVGSRPHQAVVTQEATRYQPPAVVDEPAGTVELVSLTCDDAYGETIARIHIRNRGSTTISFAQAMVKFDSGRGTNYFHPTTIPPGAFAEAKVFSDGSVRAKTCTIDGMQDGDGRRILTM